MTSYLITATPDLLSFLQNSSSDYTACVHQLKELVSKHFQALNAETNPVTLHLSSFSSEQLAFLIKEYSGFSREAIHYLLDAMIRVHDWPALYDEIKENIEEEQGKHTKGIPHLEMMRQGYKIDLGIDTDEVSYCEVTQFFLKKMRKIFNHNDNAYIAGGLLAFEGSAIAEFHIIDKIIKEYDHRVGSGKVKNPTLTLTNLYIDGHKNFEIEHEAHLCDAIHPYIHEANIHKMIKGYLKVCTAMNTWWEQLTIEAYDNQVGDILKFEDIEFYRIMENHFQSGWEE